MSLTTIKSTNKGLIAANMFLLGSDHEYIAKEMQIPVEEVKRLLAQDNVQSYIDKTSSNEELAVHIKRIKKAGELMDGILTQLEELVHDKTFPMKLWKDSHVSLVKDVLLAKLPNTMMKTIGLAISMNFGGQQEISDDSDALKSITKKLEPGQLILFRELIDSIGQLFLSGDINTINAVKEIIAKSNEVQVVESTDI